MNRSLVSMRSLGVSVAVLALSGMPLKATTYLYSSTTYGSGRVIGTGTTDTNYTMNGQHTAYANVTVRSPSGRSVTVSGSHLNAVTVTAYLDLAGEDGTFWTTNAGSEYCPVAKASWSDGTIDSQYGVTPYVYISNVTANPTSVARQSGSSTVTVNVGKSFGCGASSVRIDANTSSAPATLQFLVPNPSNATPDFANNVATATFRTSSMGTNTVAGSIIVDALVSLYSPCVAKDGVTQKSVSITVQ